MIVPAEARADSPGSLNGVAEQPAPECLPEAAEAAGLSYVSDADPGIRRVRSGRGFAYRGPNGQTVRDPKVLKRIRGLVLPPAWKDVWIAPSANGHLQATGRDERGRKQYRYHDDWTVARDAAKFDRLAEFAALLPCIRSEVDAHMSLRGLPREKVLATVVSLLERTLIRIGNAEYARANGSYGLTTLRDEHVAIDGSEMRFRFKGKTGKVWSLSTRDRRIARIVRSCQDLPGQHLFQYLEPDGEIGAVTSGDVNSYLQDIAGAGVTAKDFRTWAGTVLAAVEFANERAPESKTAGKRTAAAVMRRVAERLGNTVTICRKCYVHPALVEAYLDGALNDRLRLSDASSVDGLTPPEAAVSSWLAGEG